MSGSRPVGTDSGITQHGTRADDSEEPGLPSHARVVVIGGGVAGASAIYHLARMGWTEAVLLERSELTSGSTWHAAGNCPNFATDESLMRLQRYSNRLYSRLGKEVGCPIDYHVTGAVRLAKGADRMHEFRHIAGMARRLGIGFAMLDRDEIRARFPFVELDGVLGAQWDPDDGDIDPAQLTQAFAKGARDLGARILRFCRVTAIGALPDGSWRIESTEGAIRAEVVVNAAGYRAAEVGAMLGRDLPCVAIAHQYLVTEPIRALADRSGKLPLLRDPDEGWYLRQEREGLLLGIYEQEPVAPWQEALPTDFAFQLFPDDLARLASPMEFAMRRVPLLGAAGVRRVINGPIPYTPDGNPLIGPTPGLRNAFECCVFSFGIAQGGGAGKAVAEWVVEGETEWDLWPADPRRFTGHITQATTLVRALDVYRNEYAIAYPWEERISGRPARASPLFARLRAQGAEFGERNGWECALRFGDAGETRAPAGFGRPAWFAAVGAECRAVMNRVGLLEIPGSSRFEIGGDGAAEWLDNLLASRLPEAGRVAVGLCCSARGSLLSVLAVARLAEDRFWVMGYPEAEWHDRDWLQCHLPKDGSVGLTDLTASHDRLIIAGPESSELLCQLSPDAGLAEGRARLIEIGPARIMWLGVCGFGEAGFELHVPNEYAICIHDRICTAGANLDLRPIGLYAAESLRLEMAAHAWKRDVLVGFSPMEAGWSQAIDFAKPRFVGRDALMRERAAVPRWRFAALRVQAGETLPLAGASVFHGHECIGKVTSGGFGHRIEGAIALGYVRPDCAAAGTRVGVDILGECVPATVAGLPLYRCSGGIVAAGGIAG
jgi:dimethylglycine dehydrogenase